MNALFSYTKTILNDVLKGPGSLKNNLKEYTDNSYQPLRDLQIWRSPNQKKFEAKLLLELPLNTSFLDIGAHFGDTVLTMALHAKNNNRNDIRFYAFEPDKIKCNFINYLVQINNLNIKIYNGAVGDINCQCRNDGQRTAGAGNVTYEKSEEGNINMIALNNCKHLIEPVGLMHIDVEGSEPLVLKGASDILEKDKPYIIAECWTREQSISRGLSGTPEEDILKEINTDDFIRKDDIVEDEINMVFFPK